MSFVRYVKLRVPACNAKPGPSIGQALGPLGINMAEFCKQFNDKSQELGYEPSTPLSVRLTALSDRSFTFDVRSPPTTWLVLQAAGMEKGPVGGPVPEQASGYLTPEAVYEIAKIKQQDDMRWHLPLEGIARSVIGTARSMGVQVREAKATDDKKKMDVEESDVSDEE